jgi:altronate dehydratase small subunit
MRRFRMKRDAIMITPRDNVATALRDIGADEVVLVGVGTKSENITLRERIPFGHKFAVQDIQKGGEVLKYGEVIGRASKDISAGSHAHVHNIESLRGRGDLTSQGDDHGVQRV